MREVEVEAPVVLGEGERQVRVHAGYLANGAVGRQLTDLDAQGEISGPDSLHEEQLLLASCLHELLGLLGIDCEGLLAQHMLACFKGQHGVLEVVGVWSSDVNNVDIWVSDQFRIGTVCLCVGWSINLFQEFGSRAADEEEAAAVMVCLTSWTSRVAGLQRISLEKAKRGMLD